MEPLEDGAFYVCDDLKVSRSDGTGIKQQPSWHETRLSPALPTQEAAEKWQAEYKLTNPTRRTVVRHHGPCKPDVSK
jgi:hypothetical protein